MLLATLDGFSNVSLSLGTSAFVDTRFRNTFHSTTATKRKGSRGTTLNPVVVERSLCHSACTATERLALCSMGPHHTGTQDTLCPPTTLNDSTPIKLWLDNSSLESPSERTPEQPRREFHMRERQQRRRGLPDEDPERRSLATHPHTVSVMEHPSRTNHIDHSGEKFPDYSKSFPRGATRVNQTDWQKVPPPTPPPLPVL